MRIHVHTRVRNEETMLPYFLRHYETFCEKIFIRAEESEDKTLEIAKEHPKVVLVEPTFEYSGDKNIYDIRDLMEHRNDGWKEYSTPENCDWVIIVDCDELLYHKNIEDVLSRYTEERVTFPKILGFQMHSLTPPTTNGQIYEELNNGFPMIEYSKRAIMQPGVSPHYSPGCHHCAPGGRVVESKETEIQLFHYSKQIFGKDALIKSWERRMLPFVGNPGTNNCFDKQVIESLYSLYSLTMKSYMKYLEGGSQRFERSTQLYNVLTYNKYKSKGESNDSK